MHILAALSDPLGCATLPLNLATAFRAVHEVHPNTMLRLRAHLTIDKCNDGFWTEVTNGIVTSRFCFQLVYRALAHCACAAERHGCGVVLHGHLLYPSV